MADDQKPMGSELKYQTFTNRDYLNKIYIDKYEGAIETLMNAILENPNNRDERKFPIDLRQKLFKKSLASLYWSLIIPRIPLFDKDDDNFEDDDMRKAFKPLFLPNKDVMKTDFEILDMDKASKLLATMGEFLYSMGVTRPEKKEKDLDHIGMEERDVNT